MTLLVPKDHLADVNAALRDISNEVANWTTEERVEAIETLGGLAIVCGHSGHPLHRRVAEILVRLRDLTRSVDAAVEGYFEEREKSDGDTH